MTYTCNIFHCRCNPCFKTPAWKGVSSIMLNLMNGTLRRLEVQSPYHLHPAMSGRNIWFLLVLTKVEDEECCPVAKLESGYMGWPPIPPTRLMVFCDRPESITTSLSSCHMLHCFHSSFCNYASLQTELTSSMRPSLQCGVAHHFFVIHLCNTSWLLSSTLYNVMWLVCHRTQSMYASDVLSKLT